MNFSTKEYAERLVKTRQAMTRSGIELLLVSDPSNMSWLTGYDGWSFYTHQCVIVSMTGEPIWWGRGIDALGALRTVVMNDDNVVGYEDSYVQNPDKHPMETLAALIKERDLPKNKIGVELDNYYYSAAAHLSLTKHLPEADFTDATGNLRGRH